LYPETLPRTDLIEDILHRSGIKEIVEAKEAMFFDLVKEGVPTNAYGAGKAIKRVMMDLPKHCPDMVDTLKNGAFSVGVDMDAVLYVGSIHLRNRIFPKLGFKLDEWG
jgi:hypothetical protein